ncbi:MAG TPA: protein kinase [Micromonosporaceae bacterium]
MDAPLLPELPGYDDLQLIAHGTTALVFRATQRKLNRPVAIKVITVGTSAVPVNPARELATTVALSSQPHIVSIIDTGVTDDDRPYIVMEYCEGGSYAQILRQSGPLPVDDVIDLGVKIGEALQAAHDAGIVHRDVKPSNLLRSRFGPALTDFGIARAPNELGGTLTREMMTPQHASPEALLHQAQTGLSDVYSLASTMWTLLVGHPPFVDPNRPAVDMYEFRDRVLHDPLPPMPRADVPRWLVEELTRALAKVPAQRHSSAREFAQALRRGALGLAPTDPGPASTAVPATEVHVPGLPTQAWPWDEADRPIPPASPPPVSPQPVAAALATAPVDRAGTTDTPFDTDPVDDGGWLDPELEPVPGATTTALAFPAADPGQMRHFDDLDLRPARRRRTALVTILAVVALLAAGVAAVGLWSSPRESAPPDVAGPSATSPAAPSPTGTRFLTPASSGAPAKVQLTDRGTSITVHWADPAAGAAPFVVTGRTAAGDPIGLREVPRAGTETTYHGLDPRQDYCFLVTAVYSATVVAPSGWICTTR